MSPLACVLITCLRGLSAMEIHVKVGSQGSTETGKHNPFVYPVVLLPILVYSDIPLLGGFHALTHNYFILSYFI